MDQLIFGFFERGNLERIEDVVEQHLGERVASAMQKHAYRARIDRLAEFFR